ncbi:MAG: hypothetical protein HY308_10210 [Gammaproteobacteria bacterium]|nr:hypothetical protein [Gammaproteobacteria bacterium]
MAHDGMFGFEARNEKDFEQYSVLIENVILKMMQYPALRATKAEIGRLTKIHPNTLAQRNWRSTQDLSYGEWELAKGEPTSVNELLDAVKSYRKGAKRQKAPITTEAGQSSESRVAELTQKLSRALHHNALIAIELQKVCDQLDETRGAFDIARATYRRDIEQMTSELQKVKNERDELIDPQVNAQSALTNGPKLELHDG